MNQVTVRFDPRREEFKSLLVKVSRLGPTHETLVNLLMAAGILADDLGVDRDDLIQMAALLHDTARSHPPAPKPDSELRS